MSQLEELFNFHLKTAGLDTSAVREYAFARDLVGNPKKGIRAALKEAGLKDWRFDFAFKHEKIAVEIEGGIWTGGRHTRGKGFADDCEKYNAATLNGWRVFRFYGEQVKRGEALIVIDTAIDKVRDGEL